MTDITAFISARLDEDEQTALQDPHPEYSRPILSYIDYGEIEIGTARVLALVAAIRRMLDLRDTWARQAEVAPAELRHVFEAQVSAADAIIRGFATIWRDHDQYDPAWAPDAQT